MRIKYQAVEVVSIERFQITIFFSFLADFFKCQSIEQLQLSLQFLTANNRIAPSLLYSNYQDGGRLCSETEKTCYVIQPGSVRKKYEVTLIWQITGYNFNRSMENTETQEQMRLAEADLRRLRKDKQLPPLMQLKLAYLQALLNDSPSQNDIGELLEVEQRQVIEELPVQTKKRLFMDIIKCLSGRQFITYCRNERAYIRREDWFFPWESCFLCCNSNVLSLLPHKDSQGFLLRFELQRVCMSKNYKKYKGKFVLAIDFEGIKHIIGFDQQITCKRIHAILAELISQKKQWQVTVYDINRFIQEREIERLALPAHRVEEIINQEEFQRTNLLQQKVKELTSSSESDFTLYRSTFSGRVLKSKAGVVKTQVIIKGFDVFAAASGYIQMNKWNKAIEMCDIVARPRKNCLLAQFKTKKYSIFSYPRGATLALSFFKACNLRSQVQEVSYYLLIENIPGSENTGGSWAMELQQVLEFIPNKEDPNLLLIIAFTKADFKGFCSEADNLAMTLHITQQVEQYCQFMHSTKADTDKNFRYFQPAECLYGPMNDSDVSLPTSRSSMISQQSRSSVNFSPLVPQFEQKMIVQAMQDISRGYLNEDILEIISSRSFQNYYLKHHFSQKDESIEVIKGRVTNFLSQGIKWKIEKQELVFINAQVLAIQKDILKLVLKQVSVCIMNRKSVMNMSLPVQVFDKRSLLDAISDGYGFVPAYQARIVAAQDPVQQMKLVVAAFMFGHSTASDPNIQKPFNPILGETYQGRLGNFQVYIQQISHHPPISAVLIKNQQMELYGNVEIVIGVGLNCLQMHVTDWFRAKVHSTGTEYLIKVADIQFGGLVYGSRTFKMVNKGYIFQKKNSLFCEFSIGRDKKRVYEAKPKPKPSDVTGGIFKVNQQFANDILSCKKPGSFDGIKPENIVETYCLMSGKWLGDLYFNGVCYKSVKEGPFPERTQRMKYVLPSDSIWRPDIVHRGWRDFDMSNRQKQKLENLQRNDRKLREKFRRNQ